MSGAVNRFTPRLRASASNARLLGLALLLSPAPSRAQFPGAAPAPPVLIVTQYNAPITYQAALERLDAYYQEQVGRKLAVAFPQIAPMQHFDVWHDIWVSFEASGDKLRVTMKRPSDSFTDRLVRTWMLDFAGRLGAELPLAYTQLPPLASVENDIYASRRDVAQFLHELAAMKSLDSWQHLGLIVSASPMNMVVLEPAGLHGVHHLTVTAESAAAARQLMAKVMQGALRPCICAAFSEMSELAAEIQKEAQNRADTIGVSRNVSTLIPQMNTQYLEDQIRADPENQKRIAAANGYYDVRYRIDKPFRAVTVAWSELEGYNPADGSSQNERALGKTSIPNPRVPAAGALLNARVRLEPLKTGVFRVRIEGQPAAGEPVLIDQRVYSFDGKTFEEK